MDNLNYNHLYYFWTIATEGGVTPACKKLNLTQPTLSAQLKQFEQRVGKSLFERKARKLVLNDTGRLVFDYADTIFKKGKEMLDAIKDTSVKDLVTLNVGAMATLPKKNLHNFLKIPIAHVGVYINLVSNNFADLLHDLSNRRLDMVISTRPIPKAIKGFVSHQIETVPVVFVASPEYKNLRRKFPHSLQNQNLFLPPQDSEVREALDHYFNAQNLIPFIKGEIQDTELLRVIAVSGQGVVAIERSAVSDLIKSKEVYIIGDNINVWQSFYLIMADRKDQHPTVLEMIEKYKE